MLPEHKLEIIHSSKELKRRQPMVLDEQEWESIGRAMAQSLALRQPIAIRMYHPFEELAVIGVVDRVDNQRGRFMVDGEWFESRDIEGVEEA